MLRAVVSGATSFLGSSVAEALLANGYEVYGLVRTSSGARHFLPRHPRFYEISCDITETALWTEAIGRADCFFHFAWGGPGISGRADADLQYKNVLDTLECIHAAKALGVRRFLFAGSQAEYGKVRGITTEQTPCHPILEYGKNKYRVYQRASRLAGELGMEYVHARIFSVYGPKDHPYTLIPVCIRGFLSGETIQLSTCAQKWNFLHVNDAARALVRLGECDLHGCNPVVVNVASSDTRVLKSFVEEIHRLCGNRGSCAYGSRQVDEEPVDNWPDIGLLQSLIGVQKEVSFEDGIAELIEINLREMER